MADFDDEFEDERGRWDEVEEPEAVQKPEYDMMPLQHELTESEILSLQIQDNTLAMLGKNGRFLVRDLVGSGKPINQVIKGGYKVFMDHFAVHCFVSSTEGEMHYFNIKTQKTTKFTVAGGGGGGGSSAKGAGAVIESVAFDKINSDDSTTGTVFFGGRNDGLIFTATVTSGVLVSCKQVAQLANEANPIAGIEQEVLGASDDGSGGVAVLVLTSATRIYRFVAPPGVELDEFMQHANSEPSDFTEMLSHRGDGNALGGLSVFRSTPESRGQSYVWTSAIGIVHGLFNHRVAGAAGAAADGDFDAMDGDDGDDEPMVNQDIIPFNKQQVKDSGFERTPIEVLQTAFHLFLLYEDRFVVLCHPAGMKWKPINGSDFQAQDFTDRCRLDPFKFRNTRNFKGMVRDVRSRRVYVYNHQSIYEVSIQGEHLGMWRVFLERALDVHEEKSMRKRFFQAAVRLTQNPKQRDMATYARGLYLLSLKEYTEATKALAMCNRFEEVVHKLTVAGNPVLLHDYLEYRYRFLKRFRRPGTMQMQMACIVTMLTQLKLESLARSENDRTKAYKKTEALKGFVKEMVTAEPQTFDDRAFYNVIARLFTSHGRIEVMLYYAELMRHVHFTINYYIAQKDYKKAADLLKQYCTDESYRDAWYDFAPLIIPHCPHELINGMLKCTFKDANNVTWSHLEAERLIPTFINYKPPNRDYSSNEVIIYIDTAIRNFGCDSTTVHNYLVSLLVQCEETEYLDDFLETSEYYITEFALRRCLEARRFQQCVPLYLKLGLYTDAIQIALEGRPDRDGMWEGLETAKKILKNPSLDVDAPKRKELWKMVVLRVIDTLDTRAALSIVAESGKIIKLEDIIDRISDSTVIQNFKRDICESLKEYTTEIDKLQDEMRHATASSELIKTDILALRHRYGYVTPSQKCLLCQKPLLSGTQAFLVYPSCSHAFHEDCVVARLRSIGGFDVFYDTDVPATYLEGCHSLEDLAAAECVLCGEVAVMEITEPFFEPGHDSEWSVW